MTSIPRLLVLIVMFTTLAAIVFEFRPGHLLTALPSATPTDTPTLTPSLTPTSSPTPTLTPSLMPTLLPTSTPTPALTCPPDSSEYGFESADVFLVAETYSDRQAISAVIQSEKMRAKFGCYSLALIVDLIGGHEHKSRGEAYVDMRHFPPAPGLEAPVNLEGTLITIWVYVPGDAAGDPSKPHGVRVFVRDQEWRSEYGTWFDLFGHTDEWVQLKLTPSRQAPPVGYMDEGFDPTNIIVVGVSVGAGADSTVAYSGPIYVDGIDW